MQQHCGTQSFHHPWVSTPHRGKVHCESSNLCSVSLKDTHACDPQHGIWEVNSNTLQSEYKLNSNRWQWSMFDQSAPEKEGLRLALHSQGPVLDTLKYMLGRTYAFLSQSHSFAHLWFGMLLFGVILSLCGVSTYFQNSSSEIKYHQGWQI